MGDAAILNAVLRSYTSSSNFNELVPAASSPAEKDHFFEVQHFVALLFEHPPMITTTSMLNVSLGEYFQLATYVGDHRNIYRIPRVVNQAKKHIPWEEYHHEAHNATIAEYLSQRVYTMSGLTTVLVATNLQDMVREMKAQTGPYSGLTKEMGARLEAIMGWNE